MELTREDIARIVEERLEGEARVPSALLARMRRVAMGGGDWRDAVDVQLRVVFEKDPGKFLSQWEKMEFEHLETRRKWEERKVLELRAKVGEGVADGMGERMVEEIIRRLLGDDDSSDNAGDMGADAEGGR
jgi:hypothetical protein